MASFWLTAALISVSHHAQTSGKFENLGIPVRLGGLKGCVVGPNGKGGESLYFNLNQLRGKLFMVQVDPDTGEARQFNAPEGPGAWAFIVGPDERIYFGTWSGALILRFDPKKPELGIEVVGKPSQSEDYLWQFAIGTDDWIYACTYPSAKLVRFNPYTDVMEDLGRMHPTEMYSRSVAVGPMGKVYVGIGTTKGDLVVYDPKTGSHQSILPSDLKGAKGWSTVGVSKRADGNVYATFGPTLMRMDNGKATLIENAPSGAPMDLSDGRIISSYSRGKFTVNNPKTGTAVERTFSYTGAGDYIFVIGNGPKGDIYGSTALPLEVFRFDPEDGKSEHLGTMPGGEVYSILPHDENLYLCYYGGAIMNLYDPIQPWNWGNTATSNPRSFGGIGNGHLRPRAMIDGPNGNIYVGSEPPYGEYGGAMAVWDPELNKTIENYRNLIKNQSIVSLTWERQTGLIFGGSGNFGGGGTRPLEREAVFFAFDPVKKKKVFEIALAPGARSYPATIATRGKVYTTAGDKLFVMDAVSKSVTKVLALTETQIAISMGLNSNGNVTGLTRKGVYVLDSESDEFIHSFEAPNKIDCGFAIVDDHVYFGSGVELWRCKLPGNN